VTRHLYYLQLKDNVHNYGHVCTEEKCFQLASYALQADNGNYIQSRHGVQYFDPREYFPAWVTIFIVIIQTSPQITKSVNLTICLTRIADSHHNEHRYSTPRPVKLCSDQ